VYYYWFDGFDQTVLEGEGGSGEEAFSGFLTWKTAKFPGWQIRSTIHDMSTPVTT
jgi:hypothetical protein